MKRSPPKKLDLRGLVSKQKRRVVDTNVAVVANGAKSNATPACRLAAIEALADILKRGRIVVDLAGDMLAEYKAHCDPKGEPGVGDRFFREVLTNYSGKRVIRIDLAKEADGSYSAFPTDPALAAFDISDRKFAVASRMSGAPVMNCVDTDWLTYQTSLASHGIKIDFICGTKHDTWFA